MNFIYISDVIILQIKIQAIIYIIFLFEDIEFFKIVILKKNKGIGGNPINERVDNNMIIEFSSLLILILFFLNKIIKFELIRKYEIENKIVNLIEFIDDNKIHILFIILDDEIKKNELLFFMGIIKNNNIFTKIVNILIFMLLKIEMNQIGTNFIIENKIIILENFIFSVIKNIHEWNGITPILIKNGNDIIICIIVSCSIRKLGFLWIITGIEILSIINIDEITLTIKYVNDDLNGFFSLIIKKIKIIDLSSMKYHMEMIFFVIIDNILKEKINKIGIIFYLSLSFGF